MKKTTIGGQALIEGLMMIGPENAAIAIRKASGEIIIEKRPLPSKLKITKIPFVRGAVNLFRQMILGMKALMFSAEFVEIEETEEEEKPSKFDRVVRKILGEKLYTKLDNYLNSSKKLPDAMIYISVTISILFSVGLFMLLPNFLAHLFFDNDEKGRLYYNITEHIVRIALFIGYIYIVSFMKEIQRVWQYHGAEHKTIHCYEQGLPLTVENVAIQSTRHPRCGTSFMFLVMIICAVVFVGLPRYDNFAINAGLRVLLAPLVAGISYEILKIAGRYTDKAFMKFLNAPGLWMQNFTTKEPDDKQIEVAIEAFNNVLVEDKNADIW